MMNYKHRIKISSRSSQSSRHLHWQQLEIEFTEVSEDINETQAKVSSDFEMNRTDIGSCEQQ
jgi:hypothetical protein